MFGNWGQVRGIVLPGQALQSAARLRSISFVAGITTIGNTSFALQAARENSGWTLRISGGPNPFSLDSRTLFFPPLIFISADPRVFWPAGQPDISVPYRPLGEISCGTLENLSAKIEYSVTYGFLPHIYSRHLFLFPPLIFISATYFYFQLHNVF